VIRQNLQGYSLGTAIAPGAQPGGLLGRGHGRSLAQLRLAEQGEFSGESYVLDMVLRTML
jgi:hypothetical protein